MVVILLTLYISKYGHDAEQFEGPHEKRTLPYAPGSHTELDSLVYIFDMLHLTNDG